MLGVFEVILIFGAFALSLAVPAIGLYLLWRINARLTNIESTLATLVRDGHLKK